jgi:hypothetical protein
MQDADPGRSEVRQEVKGNCLLYACKRRLEDIWKVLWLGRIECRILKTRPPKLRFTYVSPDGVRERLEPVKPKKGWAGFFDAFWFEGRVRRR